MKKLTENIITAHDIRVKTLGNIAADTRRTLADARKNVANFATERKTMDAQQAIDLAGFVHGLSKDVQGMLKSARTMVQQFHKENMQIGREQAKNLAGFVNNLISNVGSMLDNFQKNHKQMSKEMKAKLTSEIKGIHAEVGKILGDADKLMGEFSADMAGAKRAWQSMSANMTKSGKDGFVPGIDAGKKATTIKQATRKAHGKTKTSSKS
jgi:hypothetical protein